MDSRERSGIPPDGDPATLRRLRAALELAPAGAVFSGKTAAWLHGLEIEPCDPIEMTVPIPDRIFEAAEQYVRRQGIPRSQVYIEALARFMAEQESDSG